MIGFTRRINRSPLLAKSAFALTPKFVREFKEVFEIGYPFGCRQWDDRARGKTQ
jgi:hypothetical protein